LPAKQGGDRKKNVQHKGKQGINPERGFMKRLGITLYLKQRATNRQI